MVEAASGLAQILQTYGAWGLVAILMIALVLKDRQLLERVEKSDNEHQVQLKGTIDLVEEVTTASVNHTNAIEKVSAALAALDRRLENVEKKVGA